MKKEIKVDIAILGAGTAGAQVTAQARKAGRSFVVIDGGVLGTTCARVGCMPSKVAIRIADDLHRAQTVFADEGIDGGEGLRLSRPAALNYLRRLRDGFVAKTNARTVDRLGAGQLIRAHGRFLDANTIEAGDTTVRAKATVIATGSRPVVPAAWAEALGDRLLTTDELFEQESLPDRLAVIGLGAIGLELGQALSRWGIAVTGFDMLETIAGLDDPAARDALLEVMRREFPIHLGVKVEPRATADGVQLTYGEDSQTFDRVLLAMGRRPNVDGLNLEALGVALDERGMPPFDPATLQIADLPVFFAGDANADRPVLHEAADEGRIAGWNAARPGALTRFRRKRPLGIVFTEPNVALVGARYSDLDPETAVVGEAAMSVNGRAKVLARTDGVLRVYGDRRSGRLLGATLVGADAEHLAHLLAWAIQAGQGVFELLRMPFYHPVVEEALQAALRDLAARVDHAPATPWDLDPEDVEAARLAG